MSRHKSMICFGFGDRDIILGSEKNFSMQKYEQCLDYINILSSKQITLEDFCKVFGFVSKNYVISLFDKLNVAYIIKIDEKSKKHFYFIPSMVKMFIERNKSEDYHKYIVNMVTYLEKYKRKYLLVKNCTHKHDDGKSALKLEKDSYRKDEFYCTICGQKFLYNDKKYLSKDYYEF